MACEFPYRCGNLANCYTLVTYLLTVSCFSKIQIGFTFLVPVHPGSPGKRAVERVCVGPSAQCRPSSRSSTSVGVCVFVQAQVMAMLYGDRASVVVGRVRLSVCVCACVQAQVMAMLYGDRASRYRSGQTDMLHRNYAPQQR